MNNPNTIENRVAELLKEFPETRYDDMLLILKYYDRYGCIPVGELPFKNVMQHYKNYGLPCFESIRRARQRVQSLFPQLSRNYFPPNNNGISIVINIT